MLKKKMIRLMIGALGTGIIFAGCVGSGGSKENNVDAEKNLTTEAMNRKAEVTTARTGNSNDNTTIKYNDTNSCENLFECFFETKQCIIYEGEPSKTDKPNFYVVKDKKITYYNGDENFTGNEEERLNLKELSTMSDDEILEYIEKNHKSGISGDYDEIGKAADGIPDGSMRYFIETDESGNIIEDIIICTVIDGIVYKFVYYGENNIKQIEVYDSVYMHIVNSWTQSGYYIRNLNKYFNFGDIRKWEKEDSVLIRGEDVKSFDKDVLLDAFNKSVVGGV